MKKQRLPKMILIAGGIVIFVVLGYLAVQFVSGAINALNHS